MTTLVDVTAQHLRNLHAALTVTYADLATERLTVADDRVTYLNQGMSAINLGRSLLSNLLASLEEGEGASITRTNRLLGDARRSLKASISRARSANAHGTVDQLEALLEALS